MFSKASSERGRSPRLAILIGGGLVALSTGACTRHGATTYSHAARGGGLEVSELVFTGASVQAAEEFVPAEWTAAGRRNDGSLAVRGTPGVVDEAAYPAPEAPCLDDLRVMYLRSNPDRVYYYRRERSHGSQFWGGRRSW